LQGDAQPFFLGESHLDGMAIGSEASQEGERKSVEMDLVCFSEQAEVEKLIDANDPVGQPELFDQDAFFAFLFYTGPGFHHCQ
jgi:hypothetical protein